MADSVIDKKKKAGNKSTLGFILLFVGIIIFLISLLVFGNNLIITIIGAVVMIIGFSYLKKSN